VKGLRPGREHVTTAAHAREHGTTIELAARRDGTILAMRARVARDMGAYTRSLRRAVPSIPRRACRAVPDQALHLSRAAALTCKGAAAAYRGPPARAVFSTERAVDIWRVSSAWTGRAPPPELHRRDEFPWEVGTESAQVPIVYDSGDYVRPDVP